MTLNKALQAYGLDPGNTTVVPFGTGLINHTWKISLPDPGQSFVLQQLNTAVFINPNGIAENIRNIANYLALHHPGYLFVAPLRTRSGEEMFFDGESGYYRLFSFLENSRSFDVVNSPRQAYEAARQFALFTRSLAGFDAGSLHITLANFHNLSLRFAQFKEALVKGNPDRIRQASEIIAFLAEQEPIVRTFESIRERPDFRIRVMHHDTKISNVLFNAENKGLCVIDLDTVMPGYFMSDVGDMLRTYLSAASEEEGDLEKINIREDFFRAIVQGYLSEMGDDLSPAEKAHFVFAGKFMIYMQALRFLTDHLNNDVYYGAKYEGHNLARARNQAVLLQRLMEKEQELNGIVAEQSGADHTLLQG